MIYREMLLTVPQVRTKYGGFGPDKAESLHVKERRIRNLKWLGWCRQIYEGLKVNKGKQVAMVSTRKSVLNSTKYWQTV